jgi:hypothetical protein
MTAQLADRLEPLSDFAANRSGTANRTLDKAARRLGERPVPELCERLRRSADGRFRVPGAPVAVALGEVVVHGNDALRPIGSTFEVAPDGLRPVPDSYRRLARLAFRTTAPILGSRGQVPRTLRVQLAATDMDWTSGQGPEVEGKAVDLVLLLANRRQVLPYLSGEGKKVLAQSR